jgi:hypothetical protein
LQSEVAIPPVLPLHRLIALGTVAAAAIVFTSSVVKPIYLKDQLPGIAIPGATDDERVLVASPWLMMPYGQALATSTFLRDRNAFALDLVETGKVGMPRAFALADVAVREAYRRKVPPALVLGVMLTENDEIKSTARSRQGALGLMQIHPGPWRRSLGELFGTNLRNDTTNLRYGVFILGHLSRRTPRGNADTATTWQTALLRYNGCVRGTNTPDCQRYPEIVRRRVQRNARTLCGEKNFEHCVVTPLRIASRSE